MFMRKKMKDYLAAIYSPAVEPKLKKLLDQKLISEKDAETIRNSSNRRGELREPKTSKKVVIRPTKWMYWNVHVDGLEFTHDLIVEREGVFKECVEAIKMAKILGYQVATNTTIYKETDVREIEEMFKFLSWLGVNGHTISPGYDYDAAKEDMVKRLGRQPEDFFLTRKMTHEKFAKIQEWGKKFTIFGTLVYQEFLAGKRELTCSAWAIPTYNIRGWKAPCYLMTDNENTAGHYAGYQEMLEKVDWERYGIVDGKVRDPRCENCMVHCGYDPSGALSPSLRDGWKNFIYNFSPRPARYDRGHEVNAFNGFSIGKGHSAAAKAAMKPASTGNGEVAPHVGTFCGSEGDASERDNLPAKTKEAKKGEMKAE
jgi:hopanoid biosynthesis associated radical SAM protein HpnH